MELRVIKNSFGHNSLKKMIPFFGGIILSGGFMLMAYKGKLGSETFLTYPLGLVILYAPSLAIKLLEIWKGKTNTTGGAE